MKRMTIVTDSNFVIVDGLVVEVDCSTLPSNIHAMWFDFDTSSGEVEWKDYPKPPNTVITELGEMFTPFLTQWKKITRQPTPAPAVSPSQIAVEGEPEEIDGTYYQTWVVRDRTPEEVEERRSSLSIRITDYRDRKIAQGFEFNGIMFDSRPEDQKRISGAGLLAYMAIAQGAQPGDYYWNQEADPFTWIAKDNTEVQMDAFTVVNFGKKAAEHERNHIFAARVLKDMDPIPDNFDDPSYWP